jgi:hypothetical protein
MNSNKNSDELEKFHLIYSYTEYFIACEKAIEEYNQRLIAFLVFDSFLFRFSLGLIHGRPEYLLTKTMALFLSFYSICILIWGLSCRFREDIIRPIHLIERNCFDESITEFEFAVVSARIVASKKNELLTNTKQEAIEGATVFFVAATFFFVLNAILVSCFGE